MVIVIKGKIKIDSKFHSDIGCTKIKGRISITPNSILFNRN